MGYFVNALMLGFIVVFTQVLPKAYAQQDGHLFTYTSLENEEIRDRPAVERKLEYYRSKPTTVGIYIIKMNFDVLSHINSMIAAFPSQGYLQSPPRLYLVPPTNGFVEFDEIYMKKYSSSEFRLQGKSKGTFESISINVYLDENLALGDLFAVPNKYNITRLERDIHALVQIDDSKFQPELVINHSDKVEKAPEVSYVRDDCREYSIIVAYTKEAKQEAEINYESIDNVIRILIENTNESYENSDIDLRANLVHTYQTDYIESPDIDRDLERFTYTNDGFMDEVHVLRDRYKADIAVLLTRDYRQSYCGAGWLNANSNKAFALTTYYCAISLYTLAHEIGHLQGAHHNIEVATNNFYPYGHGYYYPEGQDPWRTIMSYQCPQGNCSRIKYWSYPDKNYRGIPLGIPGQSDNARVLRNRACKIAEFR